MKARELTLRWTICRVSREGFEALGLSIAGLHRIFGDDAEYIVCVNNIPLAEAQARTGHTRVNVSWLDVTAEFPVWMREYFGSGMAEGVGWKFAPIRLRPECYELALDNDCIIWELPHGIRRWLDTPGAAAIAEDVTPCFGQFSSICGAEPRNSGIRGIPPRFDLAKRLLDRLRQNGRVLESELDEQGLQTAALMPLNPFVVRVDEVSICSPFQPHRPCLGTHGAHFVGLNAEQLPWAYEGRPASHYIRDHWRSHLSELRKRIYGSFLQ